MRKVREKMNPPGMPETVPVETLIAEDAVNDVVAERRRQVAVAGHTLKNDDLYRPGVLAQAGAAYAISAARPQNDAVPAFWPWRRDLFHPSTPRRNLVKAAALILAEIERIDRKTLHPLDDEKDTAS